MGYECERMCVSAFADLCTLGWKMDADWVMLFKESSQEKQKEVNVRGYERKSQ